MPHQRAAALRHLQRSGDGVPDVGALHRPGGAGQLALQDAGGPGEGGEDQGVHDRRRVHQGRLRGHHLPALRQGGGHQGDHGAGFRRVGRHHQAGGRPRGLRRRAPQRSPAAHQGRPPARPGRGLREARRLGSGHSDLPGERLRRGDGRLGEGRGRPEGDAEGDHQLPGEEVQRDRRRRRIPEDHEGHRPAGHVPDARRSTRSGSSRPTTSSARSSSRWVSRRSSSDRGPYDASRAPTTRRRNEPGPLRPEWPKSHAGARRNHASVATAPSNTPDSGGGFWRSLRHCRRRPRGPRIIRTSRFSSSSPTRPAARPTCGPAPSPRWRHASSPCRPWS